WILLVTGDAQLHSWTAPRSVYHDDTYKNMQLFWGVIKPKSDVTVSGIARRDFHLTTHARAAVSFPEYGEGHLDQIDSDMRPILERLNGKLATRQDNFTVNVRAGRLRPFLSVTQSSPALVQSAMAENRLAWTGHDAISITFSLTNQAGVDDTNNALFVFAVILGVAGACLIESLLGGIKRAA